MLSSDTPERATALKERMRATTTVLTVAVSAIPHGTVARHLMNTNFILHKAQEVAGMTPGLIESMLFQVSFLAKNAAVMSGHSSV